MPVFYPNHSYPCGKTSSSYGWRCVNLALTIGIATGKILHLTAGMLASCASPSVSQPGRSPALRWVCLFLTPHHSYPDSRASVFIRMERLVFTLCIRTSANRELNSNPGIDHLLVLSQKKGNQPRKRAWFPKRLCLHSEQLQDEVLKLLFVMA